MNGPVSKPHSRIVNLKSVLDPGTLLTVPKLRLKGH